MYPLSTKAPWPLNQWYIAGFSSDVGETLLSRRLLGERIVLFRDEHGTAHALSGICPHRMMPLELGKLSNNRLACGYHGLTFDLDGRCVESPTSSRLVDCHLRRYIVRETAPLLWIWLGDESEADTTPLPAQASIGLGSDGWVTQCVGYQHLKARYTLLIDNLFDLSHLAFIHASIVGEYGIALTDAQIDEANGRLTVSRMVRNVPTNHNQRYFFPQIGPVMTNGLSSEMVGLGLINAGGPTFNGPDEQSPCLGHQNFVHGFTPETPHTTHYWLMMTRDFRLDDDKLSAAIAGSMQAVVAQDRDALESIEKLIGSGVTLPKETSMKSDVGALRARARLTQMIRREINQELVS